MNVPYELPIVIIACKVFYDLIEKNLPPGMVPRQITFLEYGLHRMPKSLLTALQVEIDQILEPSLVVLGYGLCGNGLNGLKSGIHTLIIPRVDDCIAILLGSYEAYRREFDAIPGTYYLSKGWLESGSNPLQEYREYITRYGHEKAAWLMDQQYQHYKRLALVVHDEIDLKKYHSQAQEVAQYCAQWGMKYEEILGSEKYIKQLMEVSRTLNQSDRNFVVVPPGLEVKQEAFLRKD
jgi:hypothetical protein